MDETAHTDPVDAPEPTKEEHIAAIRYQIDQLLKETDEHSSAYRAMHEILPHLDAIDPGNEPSDAVGKSITW